jgi:peptide/nickel transport system ATP-binding protein/peptide/nickel transport system permease protein
VVVAIICLAWARPARVIRSQVLSLREREYVLAARALGGGDGYLLRVHLLPAVLGLGAAQFVALAAHAILAEASLSFLGLGDPVSRSWGATLHYAQIRGALLTGTWPWWVVPPGLLIALAVLGFTALHYGLEEFCRPRLRQRG